MSTFLWQSIAFGPIFSRRLGQSLGINLLPNDTKICSFNCIYCECGWTLENSCFEKDAFLPATEILAAIEHKLIECREKNSVIDSITFSGNGEPTLHPSFGEIIDGLLLLRKRYYPDAAITCLSNSTQLHRQAVLEALKKIDNPILKLDAGNEALFQLINKPTISVSQQEVVQHLKKLSGIAIIQTLFLKGKINNHYFDNSNEDNIDAWLANLEEIRPKQVMIYSLDRETPQTELIKLTPQELEQIAIRVRNKGIQTSVF